MSYFLHSVLYLVKSSNVFWENVRSSCVLEILSLNTYEGECCLFIGSGRCVKIFYSSDEFL